MSSMEQKIVKAHFSPPTTCHVICRVMFDSSPRMERQVYINYRGTWKDSSFQVPCDINLSK